MAANATALEGYFGHLLQRPGLLAVDDVLGRLGELAFDDEQAGAMFRSHSATA